MRRLLPRNRVIPSTVLAVAAVLSYATPAGAQDANRPLVARQIHTALFAHEPERPLDRPLFTPPSEKRPVPDVLTRVLLDPTTFGPAAISYHALYHDWMSSQPFFRNGYVERNASFTVSGRPDDLPVPYAQGNRTNVKYALLILQVSAAHNLTESLLERWLVGRYPHHRKLVRTLGWIERVSVGAYLSYRVAAPHYRQWMANERAARRLGFK